MLKEKTKELSTVDAEFNPTMEEILRSIRGVMSDNMAEEKKEKTTEEEVLELTDVAEGAKDEDKPEEAKPEEAKSEPAKAGDEPAKVEGDEIEETKPENADVKEMKVEEVSLPVEEVEDLSEMLSNSAAAAATDSIRDLVKKTATPSSDGLSFRGGTTVEEIVIEAMKPKLSEWLDKNLPTIVKALVSKEIKKLIPKEDN